MDHDLHLRMLWLNGISSLLYQRAARLTYLFKHLASFTGFLNRHPLSCSFWSLSISKGALWMKVSSPYYTWTANKGSGIKRSGCCTQRWRLQNHRSMGFICAQNGTEHDSQPNQTMAPAGDKLYFKHSFRNSDGLLKKAMSDNLVLKQTTGPGLHLLHITDISISLIHWIYNGLISGILLSLL